MSVLFLHLFQEIIANHENRIRINQPGLHELKKWFCRPMATLGHSNQDVIPGDTNGTVVIHQDEKTHRILRGRSPRDGTIHFYDMGFLHGCTKKQPAEATTKPIPQGFHFRKRIMVQFTFCLWVDRCFTSQLFGDYEVDINKFIRISIETNKYQKISLMCLEHGSVSSTTNH